MRFFWICENLGYLWPFAVGIIMILSCMFIKWSSNKSILKKKFSKFCFQRWVEFNDFTKNVKKTLNFVNVLCALI